MSRLAKLRMVTAMLLTLLTTLSAMAIEQMKYSTRETVFSLNVLPDAQAVKLRLYDNGTGGTATQTLDMSRSAGNVFTLTVKGNLKGKFYTFDVQQDGKWLGECAGINATAVGVNGKRAAVVDMRDTDPQGWKRDRRPDIAPQDLVLYEMHHRDFSIDASGGFKYPGKFLALTEPQAIAHLKRLGVNAVHILPSFDYASVDEAHLDRPQYNWGYDPLNYNVPEGSYSTDPFNPVTRIREFKLMVQALHQAGIKVILDVVYNHTFSIDGSNFQRTCPDMFYRKTADGKYSNGSGCGNEVASERPMVREFMIQSVLHWLKEYHIDGFRFDLMGCHDIETMNAIRQAVDREVGRDIFIYGEGWSAGGCALPNDKLGMKSNVKQMPRIAAFSDDIRDALRGPWDDDHKSAFLAGKPGNEESIKMGIVGAIEHPQVDYSKVNYSKEPWALQPTQLISYVSCHDDMCLVDRLRTSMPHITTDELIRLDLLAQTAVMTSQGVPFMLSGEEMLRDKRGVHNSYNSPDSINHLDWGNLERYPQVMAYYSNLIHMRKSHPLFHLGDADQVRQRVQFLPVKQSCVVAYRIQGAGVKGETWGDTYVVLNSNRKPVTIDVPQGSYTVVCRNIVCDQQGIATMAGGTVTVPAQSALIFHN